MRPSASCAAKGFVALLRAEAERLSSGMAIVAEGMVELWSWTPGGGARSRLVEAVELQRVREELLATGATAWISRAPQAAPERAAGNRP
jgi:hypothetical protein